MNKIGAVAIGKNEGERLHACLRSLKGEVQHVVYVDSESTDGSIEFAESLGVIVVQLDMSQPFTAARARNAGFESLLETAPDLQFVQFIDGDCKLVASWLPNAHDFLVQNPAYAVACGRRRERFPEASVYNYLCDVEWNTPIGDADACGGDALMRVDAFKAVGGFDSALIAGEEPELCVRLRRAGHKIRRLDIEMTLHDAAMTQFSQWWQRSKRAGHAFAEGAAMHGRSTEQHWVEPRRRIAVWGVVLPAIAVLGLFCCHAITTVVLALYAVKFTRLYLRNKRENAKRPVALAFFLTLSKIPEAQGMLRYYYNRHRNRRATLIEYKR